MSFVEKDNVPTLIFDGSLSRQMLTAYWAGYIVVKDTTIPLLASFCCPQRATAINIAFTTKRSFRSDAPVRIHTYQASTSPDL